MGWLGDLLGGIGDVGKKVAPFTAALPFIGPLGSAAIGAGAGALGKLNDEDKSLGSILGSTAGGAALGGLGGYGVEKLGGLNVGGPSGNLGSLISDNPMKALQLGGAGLSAIEGSRQQSKVNKLIEEELERIRKKEDSRLPYQDMLMKSLEGQVGDSGRLGAIYGQSQNPFAQGQSTEGALGSLSGATQPTAPMSPRGSNRDDPYGRRF